MRFASDFKGFGLGFSSPSPRLAAAEAGPGPHMGRSNNVGELLPSGLAPEGSESARLGRSWQASWDANEAIDRGDCRETRSLRRWDPVK